ncbi:hypothetical protein BAE44_0024255 [Dichanthelium oligosanthes]|uniref:F-box domain-containing protein n=1 Tax=Dichanthelium oligosanthes TaxID=888268 RepID=A0A1E5UPH3_9POAL|nr:hypothetical protein BAE44_0024255 [Dichanthelium oligosanthes]
MTPHTPPAKRRRSTASGTAIPEDILVTEVLARLPVRSLLRFRSVCRSWRAAIDDPSFVRRHLQLSRGRTSSVLDVPCEPRLEDYWGEARSKELEFRRIRHGVRRQGETAAVTAELMHAMVWPANRVTAVMDPVHCDGMVLVPTASGELFVCNPATREFVALPPGSPGVQEAVAFGFDPCSNAYKVARIFVRQTEFDEPDESDSDDEGGGRWEIDGIGNEVFTLGAGSWEPTDDPPYYVAPIRPICTRGAFYWTAVVGAGCADDPPPTELLRFCLRDETFTVVPNPPCFSQSSQKIIGERDTLTELGGKLCCAHARTPTGVDIWLADDGPRPEWSVAYRFELLRPIVEFVLPLAADGDELLLSVDRRMLYKYNATSKALDVVVDMQRAPDLYGARPPLPLRLIHHAVPYVESLVSIGRHNY